jgi:hypothetical protein
MITSCVIHYLDWQAGNNFGSLAHTATIRSLVCSREMRPLAFLDPSAFPGTNSDSETIASGLPVIDFAYADGRRSGFRFAARAVAVVGVAFVVELLQARGRGVVAADGLGTGDLEELS